MIRQFIEKTLGKVFATHARDPDPAKMNAYERRDAADATEPSGRPMHDERADGSFTAASEARQAMDPGHPMEAPYVDESEAARVQSQAANEPDGSYLKSDLVDASEAAESDARQVNPHEAPRSEPADDTETAREDIERANRKTEEGGNAWQERKKWPG